MPNRVETDVASHARMRARARLLAAIDEPLKEPRAVDTPIRMKHLMHETPLHFGHVVGATNSPVQYWHCIFASSSSFLKSGRLSFKLSTTSLVAESKTKRVLAVPRPGGGASSSATPRRPPRRRRQARRHLRRPGRHSRHRRRRARPPCSARRPGRQARGHRGLRGDVHGGRGVVFSSVACIRSR